MPLDLERRADGVANLSRLGQGVGFAQAARQPGGDLLQQEIAGVVAQVVVDRFDVIQMEHHRQALAVAPGTHQRLREAVGEKRAVAQVRQRIVPGEVADLRARRLAIRTNRSRRKRKWEDMGTRLLFPMADDGAVRRALIPRRSGGQGHARDRLPVQLSRGFRSCPGRRPQRGRPARPAPQPATRLRPPYHHPARAARAWPWPQRAR